MVKKSDEKRERFCQEYVIDRNGTRAAGAAGHKGDPASLAATASRLLKNDKVRARIDELDAERSERTKIDADRVLKELALVAFADMDDFAKIEDGKLTLLDSDERKKDCSRVIKKISQSQSESNGETCSSSLSQGLELHDKLRALELIGKHFKMFTEKHEHSGPDGGPIPLANLTDEELEARVNAKIRELLEKKSNGSG